MLQTWNTVIQRLIFNQYACDERYFQNIYCSQFTFFLFILMRIMSSSRPTFFLFLFISRNVVKRNELHACNHTSGKVNTVSLKIRKKCVTEVSLNLNVHFKIFVSFLRLRRNILQQYNAIYFSRKEYFIKYSTSTRIRFQQKEMQNLGYGRKCLFHVHYNVMSKTKLKFNFIILLKHLF